jgi:hypothetical protein
VNGRQGFRQRVHENRRSSRPSYPVFKRFRIAVLLYILLFVALGQFLASRRATDWDASLWVDVYLINGGTTRPVQSYIDSLQPDVFAEVERFFQQQSEAFGLDLDRPFRIRLASQLDDDLPSIPTDGGLLSSIVWSLKMRWFVTRLHWDSDTPTPDITLFAIYHDEASGAALDRSTALRKGMIAVANLFGSRSFRGSNQMVVAHEILHTLGASDKYDPATNLPIFPTGFANPDRDPLYPQSQAELMAGRIPISANEAQVPRSLDAVSIGAATAFEIGWRDEL